MCMMASLTCEFACTKKSVSRGNLGSPSIKNLAGKGREFPSIFTCVLLDIKLIRVVNFSISWRLVVGLRHSINLIFFFFPFLRIRYFPFQSLFFAAGHIRSLPKVSVYTRSTGRFIHPSLCKALETNKTVSHRSINRLKTGTK